MERECNWCLSEPRTVRFGCGHSLLCGGCLEAFLATNKPCVPLHPRAEEDALMLSCHGTRGLVLWSWLTSGTSPVLVVFPIQPDGVVLQVYLAHKKPPPPRTLQ